MSKWGLSMANFANTIRAFWPSDNCFMGISCCLAVHPYLPSQVLAISNLVKTLGYKAWIHSNAFLSKSNTSSKCCVNFVILRWPWGRTAPRRGVSSPLMIFTNVDLPAPFGPTNAILESRSKPKSTFSYKFGPSPYPKVNSFTWRTGGLRCPGSGNRNFSDNFSTGFSVKPDAIFFANNFSFDLPCLANLAVPWPNLATYSFICFKSACSASQRFICSVCRSLFVSTKLS
mmetsp:Transcript_7740/g.24278  ORF Transcript_7740/g.24278 Transcript_7740/m.24278 type:complete len:230 (-) Transcript_7740:1543-2232(-)